MRKRSIAPAPKYYMAVLLKCETEDLRKILKSGSTDGEDEEDDNDDVDIDEEIN